MKNLEIAKIFYEIADILELQGVEFKPAAYRMAAKSIEILSEDIKEIYNKGKLKDITGVGEHISKKIEEIIKTGRLSYFDRLKKEIPANLQELLKVPGMGHKKAKLFYQKLRITSIKELEKAAKEHKLAELEGMGAKSEEDILKGIAFLKEGEGRILLGYAYPVAEEIVSYLRQLKNVERAVVAGSLRRMKETIRDIDILVTSSKPAEVMNHFVKFPSTKRVLSEGKTKASIILNDNLQVDVRVVDKYAFGSAMQYFTGSKEHSIHLREIAIKKGLKLSEYGVFRRIKSEREELVASKTEKDVYNALGMQYIEPELRENTGEIEVALQRLSFHQSLTGGKTNLEKMRGDRASVSERACPRSLTEGVSEHFDKKLPDLMGYNEIKGDFHVHSNYSDGSNRIEEIANAAAALGYEYICITDHSKSQRIANGLDEKRLLRQIGEIDRVNKMFDDFRILKGTEVDIKADGSLDLADSVLKKLDIVVASVHSRFKSTKEEMTKRILKAFDNKHMNILAHPTGRLINKREPYQVDIEKVSEKAKQNNISLEINAFPERLDLNDINIRMAKEFGVRFAIGTDSHNLNHLQFMNYGVGTARRGWCEKRDILNSLNLDALLKSINR